MHQLFKNLVPAPLRPRARTWYWRGRHLLQPNIRRAYLPGETTKAHTRREREQFFTRYASGKGLDIGYGGDPLTPTCDVWDVEHGDAETLRRIPDRSYDFVYSSHTLEHLPTPATALKQWWRIIRPGGYLILYLPDRDLYEKRRVLPSLWNPDHKWFFLLESDDPPHTLGILPMIAAAIPEAEVCIAQRCMEGHTIDDPKIHSDGEYSIEIVLRKPHTDGRDSSP